MHIILAVFNWFKLFYSNELEIYAPILMFGVVVIMTVLAGTWYFKPD